MPYKLVQTYNGQVIDTFNFNFLDHLQAEDFEALTGKGPGQPETFTFSQAVAIIKINYTPGAQLSVIGPQGQSQLNTDTLSVASQFTKETMSAPRTSTTSTLDLLFISNNYPDSAQFYRDAEAMYTFLTSIPPFDRYRPVITYRAIYNQTSLGCVRPATIPRLITCDLFLINQVAAPYASDSIIVIDNSQSYGGAGYLGANVAVTYRDIDALAKPVMVHEFGHSFASLGDEYDYNLNHPDPNPSLYPNCDLADCSKWLGEPNTGCFATCGYSNLYRSTYNDSLMRTLFPDHGYQFGPVAETHIARVIQTYLDPRYQYDTDADLDLDFIDYQNLTHFVSHPPLFDLSNLILHYGFSP